MEAHVAQAKHNQELHDCIDTTFTGKFYDWKITILFYTALHYLKALAKLKGIDIGETHTEIEKNVRPNSRNHPTMAISNTAWTNYKNLYLYSCTARYEGMSDIETFENLKQVDHTYCLQHIADFKKYIISNGVKL